MKLPQGIRMYYGIVTLRRTSDKTPCKLFLLYIRYSFTDGMPPKSPQGDRSCYSVNFGNKNRSQKISKADIIKISKLSFSEQLTNNNRHRKFRYDHFCKIGVMGWEKSLRISKLLSSYPLYLKAARFYKS